MISSLTLTLVLVAVVVAILLSVALARPWHDAGPSSGPATPFVLVVADRTFGWPAFQHVMEYCYFFADVVLSRPHNYVGVVFTSDGRGSRYVESFVDALNQKLEAPYHLEIKEQMDPSWPDAQETFTFNHITYGERRHEDVYLVEGQHRKGLYTDWFAYDTAHVLRDLLVSPPQDEWRIGLVNREEQSGRILVNEAEIIRSIQSEFNMPVEVTRFEEASFDDQINFFRAHKILISPHGAQLMSIPFAPDDALIVECCEAWCPSSSFPGLSFSTKKYHVVIKEDVSTWPEGDMIMEAQHANITASTKDICRAIRNYLGGHMPRNSTAYGKL